MDSRLLVLITFIFLGLTLNSPSHAQSGDGGTDFDEIDSKAESSLDAEINAQSNTGAEATESKPTESLDGPTQPAVEQKAEPKKSRRELNKDKKKSKKEKAIKGKKKAKEKMQRQGNNKKKSEARPAGAQKKKAVKKAAKKAAKKNQRKKR